MSSFSFLKNKWTKFFAAAVIGIVCLVYVINSFGWREIWQSLAEADLILLFFGSAATIVAYFFVRTARWHLLLRDENLSVPFGKLYLYNSVAIGLSTVTPFQSGEALKVEVLRKYGCDRLSGYTIFFLERLLDLAAVVGLAVAGVWFGFDFGIAPIYFYLLAAGLTVGSAVLLIAVFTFPAKRLEPLKNLLREKWRRKTTLFAAAFLTVAAWLTIVLGWQIALRSVAVEIDFLQAISLVALTTLVVIVSFVPGAVGVAEIGISAVLMKMGIAATVAQTGAIAVRGYALVILALTLAHWIILKFVKNNVPELPEKDAAVVGEIT